MHHIYHTEGIILESRGFGEAGKRYKIFTRDLGMIHASAQGVRKMSSKLRFVLQDFSVIKVDLVRGKDFWRLTSASKTEKLENIVKRKETFVVCANIARLLKRLLAGEEANEGLYADLISGLEVLEKANDHEQIRNTEAVLVLRILSHLGYIGGEDNINGLIKSPFEENLILEAAKKRPEVLSQINKALRETHL